MSRHLVAGTVLTALVCVTPVVAASAAPTGAAPRPGTATIATSSVGLDAVGAARQDLARHSVMLAGARRVLPARLTAAENAQAAVVLAPSSDVDVARAARDWQSARSTVSALTVLVAADRRRLAEAEAAALVGTATVAEVDALPAFAGGGTADPRAVHAVRFALAQQGEPYRWGATGPDRWDCSGLVLRAYGSAGVRVPRTSREQFWAGARVGRADLLPGDLVFLADDPADPRTIHHVGLYVGDGLMVHAPRTGDVVRVARVPSAGYAGAVRVVAAGPVTAAPNPALPVVPTPVQSPSPSPAPSPVPSPTPSPSPTDPPTDPPAESPTDPPTDPPAEPPSEPPTGTPSEPPTRLLDLTVLVLPGRLVSP